MNTIHYILIACCALSILSLLNKGVRHLYVRSLDDLYMRCFIRRNRKFHELKLKDYLSLPLNCLGEIIVLIFTFVFSPVIIVWHLPGGGFQYRFTLPPFWKTESPPPPIKTEYLYPPVIIRIKEDIPFTPDKRQILYFETSYNVHINDYILNNPDKLHEDFKFANCSFVYFPKDVERKHNLDMMKALQYNFPSVKTENLPYNRITSRQIEETILRYVDNPDDLGTGLLRYKQTENGYHLFTCYQFRYFEANEIGEQFRAYIKALSGLDGKMYSLTETLSGDCMADQNFPFAAKELINEIKEKIAALKQLGVDEMILKSIFSFEADNRLSRLVITNEYRIILPDYHNMDITMYPLPKAVFFLFLNHPEGILFKNLPDYRDELIAIYKKVSGRENIEDMIKSIDDVVNPTLNSINEKCSRIREAFISKFDEAIAKNYFITGERATPKKILLDRDLVIFDGMAI